MDFLTWHHLTHQNPPKRGRMEAGCFQVLILGAKNLKTLRRFPKGEFIETGLVLCSLKAKPQKLKMQPPHKSGSNGLPPTGASPCGPSGFSPSAAGVPTPSGLPTLQCAADFFLISGFPPSQRPFHFPLINQSFFRRAALRPHMYFVSSGVSPNVFWIWIRFA